MSINWITVLAQVVNFLILVWLLKRFLYKPVVTAISEREQHIANQLELAGARERDAIQNARAYQDKITTFEAQQSEMMDEARIEVEKEKKQLLEHTREAVAEQEKSWRIEAQREKHNFTKHLQSQLTEAVIDVSQAALTDLAGAELEQLIISSFINQLKTIDLQQWERVDTKTDRATIETSFELDGPMRSRLTRTVHRYLNSETEIDYRISPALICGIQLTVSGSRLRWHLSDYFSQFSTHVENSFSTAKQSVTESRVG